MIRKNNSKLRNCLTSIVGAGALGLSVFGGIQDSYAKTDPNYMEGRIIVQKEVPDLPIQIPQQLIQQTPDFYKDPHKEFEFYRNTYIALAEDGIIDSKDVEKLEYVLGKTVEEIGSKIYNKHGTLRDTFPENVEGMEYTKLFIKMKQRDLGELRAHLKLKEEWLESKAVKGNFWNYGTGLFFYLGPTNNGNIEESSQYAGGIYLENGKSSIGLEKLFDGSFYRHVSKRSVEKGTYNNVRVPKLSKEFPAKTKIPYWWGLLGGLLIPAGLAASGAFRKKKRGKKLCGKDTGMFWGATLGNFGPGWLFLDSIHPLVFPTRLAIPIVYEGAQWAFGRRDYSKTNSEKSEDNKPKEESKKERVPDLPTEFINPWEINPGSNQQRGK